MMEPSKSRTGFVCDCGYETGYDGWTIKEHTDSGGQVRCPACGSHVFNEDFKIYDAHIKLLKVRPFSATSCWDHLRYDSDNHVLSSHPYHVEPEELMLLIKLAKDLDYTMSIRGNSSYHPSALVIHLKPKRWGNLRITVGSYSGGEV